MKVYNKGFTLVELLIVIVILGVLASLISGSFIISLKKGRDAKRKADLETIQKGLEMYYEDNLSYPGTITSGGSLCHPNGCDTKMYLKKVPKDPSIKSGCSYVYKHKTNPEGYILYSVIENDQDNGNGVLQSGYTGTNCGCGICKYKIASTNLSD